MDGIVRRTGIEEILKGWGVMERKETGGRVKRRRREAGGGVGI